MRPSGVQTLTRTTGSFNTRARITRPKRAWALRSPASSCRLRAGSAMPSPASRVISLASRIASPRAWRRRTAVAAKPSARTATRLAAANHSIGPPTEPADRPARRPLVRLTRRAMSIPGVWQSPRVVGPMSTGGLDRRTGTVDERPQEDSKGARMKRRSKVLMAAAVPAVLDRAGGRGLREQRQ